MNGALAPLSFTVNAAELAVLVNAMPEWQPRLSVNTLLDDEGEIEALMVRAGDQDTTADAYGVTRTLARRL